MKNKQILRVLTILSATIMQVSFAGGPSGPQENLIQDAGSWEQVVAEGK